MTVYLVISLPNYRNTPHKNGSGQPYTCGAQIASANIATAIFGATKLEPSLAECAHSTPDEPWPIFLQPPVLGPHYFQDQGYITVTPLPTVGPALA
jgi:hypothetical protein